MPTFIIPAYKDSRKIIECLASAERNFWEIIYLFIFKITNRCGTCLSFKNTGGGTNGLCSGSSLPGIYLQIKHKEDFTNKYKWQFWCGIRCKNRDAPSRDLFQKNLKVKAQAGKEPQAVAPHLNGIPGSSRFIVERPAFGFRYHSEIGVYVEDVVSADKQGSTFQQLRGEIPVIDQFRIVGVLVGEFYVFVRIRRHHGIDTQAVFAITQ